MPLELGPFPGSADERLVDIVPIATLKDAPTFQAGSITFRVLATPSRGSHEITTWRAELAPNASSGVHSLDHEQLMVVSDGAVTLIANGTALTGGPGDVLILPASTDLELRNDEDTPSSATVISPVGFAATAGGQTFSPPWSL